MLSLRDSKAKSPIYPLAAGCLFVLLAIFIVAVYAYLFFKWRVDAANHDFERLLGGDTAITLSAMEISVPDGKQERVEDPELVNYLSEMFRHAEPREGECGICYQVEFRLSTGKRINCGIVIPHSCDQITIAFPFYTMGDPISYGITLKRPIPKNLDELFFKLGYGERTRTNATEGRKKAIPP
ncbi:MAG: hypothetical protein WCJ35_22910 [Planctomycetota bacterium]